MSFVTEASRIQIPSRWYTLGLFVFTVLVAWGCLCLDNARMAAFIVPAVSFLEWCSEAKISFTNTWKIKLSVWAFCLMYLIACGAFVAQVLSVESGDPFIASGPIFDLSALMARTVPQA